MKLILYLPPKFNKYRKSMKINAKSYLWLLFAGLIGFSSCSSSEEETPVPTLTINTNSLGSDQTGGTDTTGATVTINLTAKADENIAKLNATKTVSGTETTLSGYPKTSDFNSSTEHTWNATYKIVETSGTVTLKFSVEDKKGKITSKTFTITVKQKVVPPTPDLNSWSAVLLGGQDNATVNSYFASSTGQTFNFSAAVTNVGIVDITYAAMGTSSTPTLLSYAERKLAPLSQPNVPSNALETKFAATSVTASEFTSLVASTEQAFVSGAGNVSSSSSQSVGIEAGKVYSFLSNGKKGLVHIQSISPGKTGSVTINVKVQQ
jgi:hypothetical protein